MRSIDSRVPRACAGWPWQAHPGVGKSRMARAIVGAAVEAGWRSTTSNRVFINGCIASPKVTPGDLRVCLDNDGFLRPRRRRAEEEQRHALADSTNHPAAQPDNS